MAAKFLSCHVQLLVSIVALSASCLGNQASHASEIPYFKITGQDFRQTQVERICLLAKINASIEVTYKTSHPSSVEVPLTASTEGSYCDQSYVSQLKLTFERLTLTLDFRRDKVPNVVPGTQNQYCLRCDDSNWNLGNVTLEIPNVTSSFRNPDLPPTMLKAYTDKMPVESGPLHYGGVDVQRSYKCNTLIPISVPVVQARDLENSQSDLKSWSAQIKFHYVQFEPFLVTNSIHDGQPFFKDPLLCSEVQIFHVLVILLPIVYFIFFVVICRVRERYGCPPSRERFHKRKILTNEDPSKEGILSDKKKVPPTSTTETSSSDPAQKNKEVVITLTPAESSQSQRWDVKL